MTMANPESDLQYFVKKFLVNLPIPPYHINRTISLKVLSRIPDGLPWIRDPENPCEYYHTTIINSAKGCETDGHYLCRECINREIEIPPQYEKDDNGEEMTPEWWERKRRARKMVRDYLNELKDLD